MGAAVYFSDPGKGRKTVLGHSLAYSDSADRLLSRRRQKDSGQQQVPK